MHSDNCRLDVVIYITSQGCFGTIDRVTSSSMILALINRI